MNFFDPTGNSMGEEAETSWIDIEER